MVKPFPPRPEGQLPLARSGDFFGAPALERSVRRENGLSAFGRAFFPAAGERVQGRQKILSAEEFTVQALPFSL